VKKINPAFNRVTSFVSARIDQVGEITKPQKNFLKWIFEIWRVLYVITFLTYTVTVMDRIRGKALVTSWNGPENRFSRLI